MKNAFIEYKDFNEISNFNCIQEKQLSDSGITSCDIDPHKNAVISVGYDNGRIDIFGITNGKILASHTDDSSTSPVIFNQFLTQSHTEDNIYELLTVTLNGSLSTLSYNTESSTIKPLYTKTIGTEIVQSTLHPMGVLLFSILEAGRCWNVYDLESNNILYKSDLSITQLTS